MEPSQPTSDRDDEPVPLWEEVAPCRSDKRVIEAAAPRVARLRGWLRQRGLDGAVISRRDHFAWLTAGGDNRVLNNSEAGFGTLVITADRAYLVAHSMDATRLLEEQVPCQAYELVAIRWYEGDPRRRGVQLAGEKVAADTPVAGATDLSGDIAHLHYPLDSLDLARLRWLGRKVAGILEDMAVRVQPGMTEERIAQDLQGALLPDSIDLDVLIVGSDERIFRYRHPLPTPKSMQRYLLLHPAARRWGLHANVSRTIHFGTPPEPLRRAYRIAATVEARILKLLRPGLRFSEILERQKSWYADLGAAGEWELHFQGGPTGYVVVDANRCLTNTSVEENQAFDWFVTVTGAKVEELSLLTSRGVEVASNGGGWPLLEVETDQGNAQVPDIWIR